MNDSVFTPDVRKSGSAFPMAVKKSVSYAPEPQTADAPFAYHGHPRCAAKIEVERCCACRFSIGESDSDLRKMATMMQMPEVAGDESDDEADVDDDDEREYVCSFWREIQTCHLLQALIELFDLQHNDAGDYWWQETARWMKYEEDTTDDSPKTDPAVSLTLSRLKCRLNCSTPRKRIGDARTSHCSPSTRSRTRESSSTRCINQSINE